MSTQALTVFHRLRDLISATDLNLSQLSRRTGVPYAKLRRFVKKKKSLSLEDAEALHLELTGTTFITTPDDLSNS